MTANAKAGSGWIERVGSRLAIAAACVSFGTGPAAAGEAATPTRSADGSTYEGGLKDGLYHGRGRLVWSSGAEYVGEFRHGLMHGEGRMTRRNGEIHEGAYAFGLRHGPGRLLTASGSRYEGEFRNGEMEGRGTMRSSSGSVYEGEFLDGVYAGRGVYTYVDGTTYRGDLRAGDFDGQGEYRWPDGDRYVGGMRNGSFDGVGQLWRGDAEYTGSFANGEYHGFGRWSRGDEVFEGTFEQGDPVEGTHRSADGRVYEGSFEAWSYAGEGVLEHADGRRYEGSFVAGEESGTGKLSWPGGTRYEGEFEDGKLHGRGTLTYASGKVYSGSFARGRFHGAGVMRWKTDAGEEKVATGTWENGEYVDGDSPELLSPGRLDAERILAQQPALLGRSLDRVAASRPGVIDLYFLGFGAWGEQDVFMKEVRFAQELFAKRFDTEGRSIALVNNRATLDAQPLATVTNLEAALRGLAERMDPQEDLLFLLLSSHGSEDHELGISLDRLPLNQLGPERLDQALDDAGIPWRVVVVSSCHSGAFIEPLADEKTLVLTASRLDRKSFGCSNDAEFTYFGGAFLRDALPEAENFVEAFELARSAIAKKEAEQKLEHSEPQIARAPQLEQRLARWRASLAARATGSPGSLGSPAAPATPEPAE